MMIRLEDGHLVFSYPGLGDADVGHRQYPSFRARWRKPWQGHDQHFFDLENDGAVAAVNLQEMQLARIVPVGNH